MALTYTKIKEIGMLTESEVDMFINPASTNTYIRCIILFNSHTSDVTVSLYNNPATGTPPTTAQFFGSVLTTGQTVMIEVPIPGIILNVEGDTISAKASVPNKVTIQMFGGQEPQ